MWLRAYPVAMTSPATSRRELHLETLDAAVDECRSLLRSGYEPTGRWSLGQICQHLRLTIEDNMNGYPTWMTVVGFPLRPILRTFFLPRLLEGRSISGMKTAGRFIPPGKLDDEREVDLFAACARAFDQGEGPLHPHPGFGSMPRDRFRLFHAAHAAHHLAFLVPREG